jgi:hypothetical protein
LLYRWNTLIAMSILAVGGLLWLRALGPTEIAPATREAPTHPT